MKIETCSPEMEEVPGADSARITITKVPCGTAYSTEFFNAEGVSLRQDQHVVVDKLELIITGSAGSAQLAA